MPLNWCGPCAAFHTATEQCFPAFRVLHEGDETEVRARDAEAAVERWARRYDVDSASYTIAGGSAEEVRVVDEAGEVTFWRVFGETVPTYHARQTGAQGED